MGKSLKPLLQVAKLVEHCCAHADSTAEGLEDGGMAQLETRVLNVHAIASLVILNAFSNRGHIFSWA